MRLEYLNRKENSFLTKHRIKVSNVESFSYFLTELLDNLKLMNIIRVTREMRIGFQLFSNMKETEPLYIPLRNPDNLKNNDLSDRLNTISVSQNMFINLNEPFEIIVSVADLF